MEVRRRRERGAQRPLFQKQRDSHVSLFPQRWSGGVAVATLLLPLLSGLLPLAGLYLLSRRARHNIGHWPMVTIDDPNNFQFDDPWYDRVEDIFWFAWGAGGVCIGLWITLVVRFFDRAPRLLLIVTPLLFVLSWIIFVHEPGQRFSWWLD